MKTAGIIILVVFAILLILTGIIAEFFFRMAISRKGLPQKDKPATGIWADYGKLIAEGRAWFLAQKPQELEIKSFDGLTLKGCYLPAEGATCTLIGVHGFRSEALKEFGGMVRFYHENHCNLLLIQQRAHKSEGNYLTFGVKERFDVQSWVRFYNEQYGSALPVFLHGVSMGCATVVMASGLALAENVKGVIADCGYTSPWDEFEYVLKHDFHLPKFPILYVANLYCRLRAGFDMKEVSTLEILKQEKLPVLFIHGTSDNFVPTGFGKQNYEQCTSKKGLLLVEGAGHALSWMIGNRQYKEQVLKFLNENA